jgi:hypothetical protein
MSSALPVSRPRMIEPESGRMQPPLEHSAAPYVPVHMSRKWTDSFGMQVARVAGGVKRGLGLGRPTHTVMNSAAAAATSPSPVPGGEAAVGAVESLADLGLHLQRAALGLFGDFVTTGQDGVSLVDYDAMRSSEAFAQYLKLTDKAAQHSDAVACGHRRQRCPACVLAELVRVFIRPNTTDTFGETTGSLCWIAHCPDAASSGTTVS